MEAKWAKRCISRARGRSPEEWSSKTAPDKPGYEVPSPENDPRAHTCTHAPARGRQAAGEKHPDGACGAVFRRGCHRRVDRPRAPRNLRFPTGEELAEKSPAAAVRRSDDEGFEEENKVTGMKHDHRKSKLGFPFGSDTM